MSFSPRSTSPEARHALTDIAVKNAKPSDKQIKLSDGKGRYLLIHPNGTKYCQSAYRYDGKEKVFSIGTSPCVSLAEARTRLRDEIFVSHWIYLLRQKRLKSVEILRLKL
ncbi:Arm DNA-binding domain-containing protein [Pantoea sp. AS142]|uniref:Arm DNA-binding domain-containing protein n=1 Tax=Pantoea sp. AS142 TaxID=3081292 RepID=UPI0030167026